MSEDEVKKVSPYPIPLEAQVTEGQPPFKGNILKLTDFGFLMQCDQSHYYRVFEVYAVQFVIPVLNAMVKTKAKVIKTYDGLDTKTGKDFTKNRIVEMHFVELSTAQREVVVEFLAKIGQKSS